MRQAKPARRYSMFSSESVNELELFHVTLTFCYDVALFYGQGEIHVCSFSYYEKR